MLFAVGLLGIRALLCARPRRTGVVGGWLAAVAAVLAVSSLLMTVGRPSSEGAFSPLTLGTFLCVLAALTLLGLAARQRTDLASATRTLPLLLGLLTFPLLAVGGAFEVVNERLLEVPLVVLGAAWMWLGHSMWTREADAVTRGRLNRISSDSRRRQ